jgi:uncharacterized protein YegP (UPF0339 family)
MDSYFEKFDQVSLQGGKHRWRFWKNGRIIFQSSEGYHNVADRDHSLAIAQATGFHTPVVDSSAPAPATRNSLFNSVGVSGSNALLSPAAYGINSSLKIPVK